MDGGQQLTTPSRDIYFASSISCTLFSSSSYVCVCYVSVCGFFLFSLLFHFVFVFSVRTGASVSTACIREHQKPEKVVTAIVRYLAAKRPYRDAFIH